MLFTMELWDILNEGKVGALLKLFHFIGQKKYVEILQKKLKKTKSVTNRRTNNRV